MVPDVLFGCFPLSPTISLLSYCYVIIYLEKTVINLNVAVTSNLTDVKLEKNINKITLYPIQGLPSQI